MARQMVLLLVVDDDAFDLDGVPPKDGTTVPGVARVVKAAVPNQPANRPAP